MDIETISQLILAILAFGVMYVSFIKDTFK